MPGDGSCPSALQDGEHSGTLPLGDRGGQTPARQETGLHLAIDALGRALNVAGEVGLKSVVLDVFGDGGEEVFAR